MLEVAQWIVANTPFDRLYILRGPQARAHQCRSRGEYGAMVVMTETHSGRRIPRVASRGRFMGYTGVNKDIHHTLDIYDSL